MIFYPKMIIAAVVPMAQNSSGNWSCIWKNPIQRRIHEAII